eukprot:511551-Heterocapsa_arctica.AAC.1
MASVGLCKPPAQEAVNVGASAATAGDGQGSDPESARRWRAPSHPAARIHFTVPDKTVQPAKNMRRKARGGSLRAGTDKGQ